MLSLSSLGLLSCSRPVCYIHFGFAPKAARLHAARLRVIRLRPQGRRAFLGLYQCQMVPQLDILMPSDDVLLSALEPIHVAI